MDRTKMIIIRQYLKEIEDVLQDSEASGKPAGHISVAKRYADHAITKLNEEIMAESNKVKTCIYIEEGLKNEAHKKLVGDEHNLSSLVSMLLEMWLLNEEA